MALIIGAETHLKKLVRGPLQSVETRKSSQMSNLFDLVVENSGLAPVFARKALKRACERAGVEPNALSHSALRTALPEIERTIELYLKTDVRAVMARLQAISRAG